jgi:hypothetical protein
MSTPWRIGTQICNVADPVTQAPMWRLEFYSDESNSQTQVLRVIPADTTKPVVEIQFNTGGIMLSQTSYLQNQAGPAVPSDEVQPPT